ncbi:S41 family peptidase [Ferruginibacter paludis]|uniref:S41 family peptidase n=1 Tax=Ferruginibacter paludis TaxID=1310417 RepID=UPI0025B2EF58|nr:S41 family peptidase [Ferruginibacter paludis]MDN3654201.1 S41 family peptidase [Ferruginibacter paludis]
MQLFKITHLLFLFAFIIPCTGSAQISKPQPVNISQLINSVTDSLNRHYIFPEKAVIISGYLKSQLNKNAYAGLLSSPQKLAEQIGHDINVVYHDPHMRVKFDPGFIPQQVSQSSPEEVQRVKKYWKENNYMFKKAAILPGNIGYLPFDLFTDDIEAAKPIITAVLKFLINTDALIIDLRENIGGSPQMVSQLESYFFKEKTHMNDLVNRTNLVTTFLYADPAKADSLYLSMPVYILTSQHTFSGAEDFSYGMQVAKRAIVVGETTGGGAHPQMPFSVGQSFMVFIPFARSLNPVTQTDWEGKGVIPDAQTTASKAYLKAQEMIFRNRLLAATDQKEKNKYLYYLNALLVDVANQGLSLKELLPFAGTYGGLIIYPEKNKLYCKNDNNGGAVSELKFITNHLFVLDKDAQVEFVKNSKGQYADIKILVNDGSVFEEKRTSNAHLIK